MKLLFALLTIIAALFSPTPLDTASDNTLLEEDIQELCGNTLCEPSESCSLCPQDCGTCADSQTEVLTSIKDSIVWVKYEYFSENKKNEYAQNSASGSGVIIDQNENYLFVLTNRHVIDCRFTNSCSRIWDENITIRTQDGITHTVERISLDPQFLDIAYLRVRKSSTKNYVVAQTANNTRVGDKVIAAGYPAYKLGGGIVEYSSKTGELQAIKELLLPNGRLLFSLESDAFTFYGSSGGGFFNEQGELMGISTWGVGLNTPDESQSIAIKIDSLKPIKEFLSCKDGEYVALDGTCQEYYGNIHRVVCFLSDERTLQPLDGRVYYDGKNQGKTVQGCREIVIDSTSKESLIEFDRDYAAGIITYNIEYTRELKKQFVTRWFVE